jgi:hypothetical protein
LGKLVRCQADEDIAAILSIQPGAKSRQLANRLEREPDLTPASQFVNPPQKPGQPARHGS